MLARRSLLLPLLAAGLVVPLASPALAHDSGAHAPRTALMQAPATEGEGVAMDFVTNVQHTQFEGVTNQAGTDIEFMTLGATDYALAGTGRNGLQIRDITDPEQPAPVAVYECPINQGDIQVFRQGERVLASYTADAAIGTAPARLASQCVTEANALGFDLSGSELGTFLVDLTDPADPTTVGFFEVPEGSHNQTIHPSGDYLYNSNSDLLGLGGLPEVTIHDISDPAAPRKVQDFAFPPVPTSLGTESHDIFFNGDGTRAYVAALSSTLILDTTKPEEPVILTQFADPTNSVVHQSDVVSLPREDGTVRELLITTDEQAGALEQSNCPGGGLHVYDITGEKAEDPLSNKLGVWFIPVAEPRPGRTCTSHVLRMHPDQGLMTIAWYSAGVRVLDISGLAEFEGFNPAARGDGVGMKEVGSFEFPDSDTWSMKTNRIEADGSFYGYGNDIGRGLDVYRFDGVAAELGRTVPVLAPEDLAAPGCEGAPIATAYTDRGSAREVHKRGIDCVIARSIAKGSIGPNATRVYRPLEDVTRGQMATFILNTLRAAGVDQELPVAPGEDSFDDTGDSVHRDAIAVLAEAGIVRGTSGGTSYAPNATVTREQMASFMVRAAQFAVEPDLAESGARDFTDVPDGGVHSDAIAIGDDNGLFQGTTATTFAPKVQVKRDQMATFLTRLLGVAGAAATPPTGTSTG